MPTPVYLEIGSKKVFACALEWPGWARAGKTEDEALETLVACAPRYAAVARAAGVRFPTSAAAGIEVVERVPGSATTDFGAPGAVPDADRQRLTKAKAERLAALVGGAWKVFDAVSATAPASLTKGPRGGGRDRDKMINHVLESESGYLRHVGLRFKAPALGDTKAAGEVRTAFLDALRAARAPEMELTTKTWPWRYAARRVAWHALDHAWEMEDRTP